MVYEHSVLGEVRELIYRNRNRQERTPRGGRTLEPGAQNVTSVAARRVGWGDGGGSECSPDTGVGGVGGGARMRRPRVRRRVALRKVGGPGAAVHVPMQRTPSASEAMRAAPFANRCRGPAEPAGGTEGGGPGS